MNKIGTVLALALFAGCANDYNVNNKTEDVPAAGGPRISVSPLTLDFGQDGAGVKTFLIESVGDDDLQLDGFEIQDGGAGFTLLSDPFNDVLPMGESLEVEVAFSPPGDGAFEDNVLVFSDDADQPQVPVQLLGDLPYLGKPTAVCSVNPKEVAPIWESAQFDGTASFDGGGFGISNFEWTWVEVPNGPNPVNPTQAPTWNFTPQLAGTYRAQLVVFNSNDVASEPCVATLQAVPTESLWVEMYWVHKKDDMDLHLLRPGGNLETKGDCFYNNACENNKTNGLEWGNPGVIDNPFLDLDDIPGDGPENINIAEPLNGTYTVVVHDYPISVYNGANDVTVKIRNGGTLLWEDTRTISGEDSYTTFATIQFPSLTVTPQ